MSALSGFIHLIPVIGLGVGFFFSIAYMWAIYPEVVLGILESDYFAVIFVIIMVPVGLVEMTGGWFAWWAGVVVLSISVAFWFLFFYERDKISQDFDDIMKKGHLGGLPNSSLVAVTYSFLLMGAFDLVYFAILILFNKDVGNPFTGIKETWYMAYLLLNASFWEEVVSRVLLIGVPLLFIDIVQKKKTNWVNRLTGGYEDMGLVVWILVLASSAMFGWAHVSSWNLFKFLPTFVSGLFFGFLYVKYGLHASIAFHFAFDFLFFPITFGQSNIFMAVFYAMLLISLMVGGLAVFISSFGIILKKTGMLSHMGNQR